MSKQEIEQLRDEINAFHDKWEFYLSKQFSSYKEEIKSLEDDVARYRYLVKVLNKQILELKKANVNLEERLNQVNIYA
jgi:chromosome segregation ATPase